MDNPLSRITIIDRVLLFHGNPRTFSEVTSAWLDSIENYAHDFWSKEMSMRSIRKTIYTNWRVGIECIIEQTGGSSSLNRTKLFSIAASAGKTTLAKRILLKGIDYDNERCDPYVPVLRYDLIELFQLMPHTGNVNLSSLCETSTRCAELIIRDNRCEGVIPEEILMHFDVSGDVGFSIRTMLTITRLHLGPWWNYCESCLYEAACQDYEEWLQEEDKYTIDIYTQPDTVSLLREHIERRRCEAVLPIQDRAAKPPSFHFA